jgi:Ni,Fe-hydrogenase I small subunit
MAVTRRQFITTLGMLATAIGIGEADLANITNAFANDGGLWASGAYIGKPKVVWVHGAECTGCSTSLLSLFEDARGVAIPKDISPTGANISTALALTVAATGLATDAATATMLANNRTLQNHVPSLNVDGDPYAVNIADVLIDFIDLQYHETIMASGGDGAYSFLKNEMVHGTDEPFVLVCEGAAQYTQNNGYWAADGDVPWCSIAKSGSDELAFAEVVHTLAARTACAAVIAIGQCATYGGYPACSGPGLTTKDTAGKNNGNNMTGAQGIYDFLHDHYYTDGSYAKVINVPGCPTNPWWFVLTVVAWLVDAVVVTASGKTKPGLLGVLNKDLSINSAAVDGEGRLAAVYGNVLHSKYCPRYPMYAANKFATKPGEPGCLKNIGCKGLWTMSSCGRHGWNNAQPQNDLLFANRGTIPANGIPVGIVGSQKAAPLYTHLGVSGDVTEIAGNCLTCGSPCMGCTEKGYPDAMTPFVVR